MADQPTVFVIDGDAHARTALCSLLASAGLAAEGYGTAADFLHSLDFGRAGCVVTEVILPGIGGFDLQARLMQRGVQLPIIFYSAHGDIPTAVRAVKAGAVDFIEKPLRAPHMLGAIQEALHRNVILRRTVADRATARARLAALTDREREVLALIADGQRSKVIANLLGIAPNTVENHRAGIMRKTRAESLVELVSLVRTAEPDEPGLGTT